MTKIQSVILAGGAGSRLRPYTTVLPKPLLPIGDFPIAEIIVRQLKFYRLNNIMISTGHLAGLIEAYFSDGKRWGTQIQYYREDRPLGTAGSLKMIKNLANDFLVINGDTLTNMNLRELLKFHKTHKAAVTIAIKERVVKTDFGVIECDSQDELINYIEKPEQKTFVSMGINVLNKRCLRCIQPGEAISMPDLILRLKAKGEKVYCFKTSHLWLDLGRFEDLETAQEIFKNNAGKFLMTE